MVDYISTAETAKLVRGVLKQKFPGVKFSVRTENGGAGCINIKWTDGPTDKLVDTAIGAFKNGGFDGMIDMDYHSTSYMMPDGEVVLGRSGGTRDSGGTVGGYTFEVPEGAREVSFGARYIFSHRAYSEDFLKRALIGYAHRWGQAEADKITIKVTEGGYAYFDCKDFQIERDFRYFINRRVIAK